MTTTRRRCGRPTAAGRPCRQVLGEGQRTCRHHPMSELALGLHTLECLVDSDGWGVALDEIRVGDGVVLAHFVCGQCGRHSYWIERAS